MNLRLQDRWFALCGVASVVVELVGTFIAMGTDKTHSLTYTSSIGTIERAFAKPATTQVWVGAYLELVSVGLFLAFAVWACAKLGGGLLGSIGRGFAVADVAVTLASLGVMNAEAYLAGRGLDLSAARALVTINGALYISTWFLDAFFLVAVALLALPAGRKAVGWSAAALAVFTLVGAAASPDNAGQFSALLWLLWIAGTSIALARRDMRPVAAPAVA